MAPSDEVNQAVGESPNYDELEREAKQLRQIVAARSEKEIAAEKLARIERQLAARRETEGTAAAKGRMVGIRRAVGSLMNEYGQDRKAVEAARAQLSEAIQTLNARAGQIRQLHAEDAALADRFGLDRTELPQPREPEAEINMALPKLWFGRPTPPPLIELDDTGLQRERRSYREVEGSEAYRIIQTAGLKSWPELTQEQREVLAEREEDHRRERAEQAVLAREAAFALARLGPARR